MGVFISNAITDRGRILLGEAQVGATFEATRIVMGSGYIPAGYTARTMTAVVAPVIELEINKKKRAGDGTVTFGGVYSNENITEAFYFREFALYARVEYADGTYSDEVLYSYGNAGDNADLMPAYSTSAVVEKQMDLVTWVGNDTAVNLTIASGISLTLEEASEHFASIDHVYDTNNPHGVTAVQVGAYDLVNVGTDIPQGANLDDYKTPGIYRSAGNAVSETLINTPYTQAGFRLVVEVGYGELHRIQNAYCGTVNRRFARTFVAGAWSRWSEYAIVDNLPAVTATAELV